MGRHLAPMPGGRRLGGWILGGVVVFALVGSLFSLGRAAPATEPVTDTAPVETTTTAPPTTAPTTERPTTSAPSTTTAPSTSATSPSTTDTTQPTTTETTIPPITLEPDGLGVVDFGAGIDETRAAIDARLGPPTSDSGWVNARGNFGTCPGSVVRVIQWGGLRAFFGDGPTAFGDGAYHFFFYSQSRADTDTVIDLRTAKGIGLGSTVAELVDAYGPNVEITSSSGFGVTFLVDPGRTASTLDNGLLSGTLTESIDTGEVTSLIGGFGCGA